MEHVFRPSQWLGFREETAARLSSLSLAFPPEFLSGSGPLVVNKASEETPLIRQIRSAFDLPYFLCLPVMVENAPLFPWEVSCCIRRKP